MADMGEQFSLGCTESGWSQLGNHLKMQFAEPAIIPKEECQANPSAGEMGYGTICAGAEGSGTAVMCPGYTGSPLACVRPDKSSVLAGLQAFTYSCLEPGAPSVYTEVAGLRDWVDYVMGKIED
jgi:secreted trypsin-like serine protease